jgi:Bacterial EndoU nuclease
MKSFPKLKFLVFLVASLALWAQAKNIFSFNAEKHIFVGEVKEKYGKLMASGCHHINAINKGTARIIKNTEIQGPKGLFKGKVEVLDKQTGVWVKKTANGGYSTFFPRKWTVEQTKTEITKAFSSKIKVPGTDNEYKGYCADGIEVRMYLKENGQIISAFPADWDRYNKK